MLPCVSMTVSGENEGVHNLAVEVLPSPQETVSQFDIPEWEWESRWKGRGRTTRFEHKLLSRVFSRFDRRRLIEIGTGTARLTPITRASATEYVGVDLNREFLERTRQRLGEDPHCVLVQASVPNLPFVNGSFSGASFVRIYNHLTRPGAALRELHRILTPGGRFIATVAVRPTLGTLQIDLRNGLAGRRQTGSGGWVTFQRGPVAEQRNGPFVVFLPTEVEMDAELHRAGAEVLEVLGAGINDLWLLRRVPLSPDGLLRMGRRYPHSFVFPQRWVVGRWGPPASAELPPLNEIFACPRCGTPLGRVDLMSEWSATCRGCAFVMRYHGSIFEAVWHGERTVPQPSPS